MSSQLLCFRAIDPKWSFSPLSGEGAALNGGRWNAPGKPALYLALDEITAVHEYNQGLAFQPLVLARYHIEDACLADLTDPDIRANLSIRADLLSVPWLEALTAKQTVETHQAAEELNADYHGLIYPSVVTPTGKCVVLWRWNNKGGAQVRVEDPEERLPKDQASWNAADKEGA